MTDQIPQHLCKGCDTEKDLTAENFQRDSRSSSGFRGRCKECTNIKRAETRQKKLEGMTQSEYSEFRKRERERNRKSAAKRIANQTPEQKEAWARRRYLREKVPHLIQQAQHLRFMNRFVNLGSGWVNFYRTLTAALLGHYGLTPALFNSRDSSDRAEYRRRQNEMMESETYRLLNGVNDTVLKLMVDPSLKVKLKSIESMLETLTPEDWEIINSHKPRDESDRLDTVGDMAPSVLRSIEDGMAAKPCDAIENMSPAEMAEIIRADSEFIENALERKHVLRRAEHIELNQWAKEMNATGEVV